MLFRVIDIYILIFNILFDFQVKKKLEKKNNKKIIR